MAKKKPVKASSVSKTARQKAGVKSQHKSKSGSTAGLKLKPTSTTTILKALIVLVGKILWVVLFPLRPLLRPMGHYLSGVRQEFRKVVWPKRREAWKLTFGVLGFSAVLVVIVQLLDYGFRILFENVIV